MPFPHPGAVSLTSTWYIKPGAEQAASAALRQLAAAVHENEPGTLAYRVHFPFAGDPGMPSLPPLAPRTVVFFEEYESTDAFNAHLNGPVFTGFVQAHGDLFEADNGHPFTTVAFLSQVAGFQRPGVSPQAIGAAQGNRHPCKMFEIIARDQQAAMRFYGDVFNWSFDTGASGFAYVRFGAGADASLGGIGQADPTIPGFEPGHNFYLMVDRLEPVIERATQAGGHCTMVPTAIDGYRFAMIADPEGNPVGLLEPFAGT